MRDMAIQSLHKDIPTPSNHVHIRHQEANENECKSRQRERSQGIAVCHFLRSQRHSSQENIMKSVKVNTRRLQVINTRVKTQLLQSVPLRTLAGTLPCHCQLLSFALEQQLVWLGKLRKFNLLKRKPSYLKKTYRTSRSLSS